MHEKSYKSGEMIEEEGEKGNISEESVATGAERQILFQMEALFGKFAVLQQMIEERLNDDHIKEEAFNRLYAEVEEVRQERSFQHIRSLLMDLILLSDRLEQSIQHMETSGDEGTVHLLKSFRDEVLEILFRRGVEVIVVDSPTFDRKLQQALKFQPVSSAEEHNQIVRVVRRGFRYGNRILRFEEVIVGSSKASG